MVKAKTRATEPFRLSAVDARRLIGRKQLSPVELMQSCLSRIKAVNPAVNAVVTLDEDAAMAMARDAERLVMNGGHLDVLHGLPVGIKDLHAVEGLRSTWGSLLLKDNVPDTDDAMVANIRVSGGLPFCKTNVPEFGRGANTTNRVFGPTCNPFDHALTSAGSSGGAAVALALDMMPCVTGSDYAGSSRTPCAFNGVSGFRPSPGLIPTAEKTFGVLPWPLQGPLGRSMHDVLLMLRAQIHVDRRDPLSTMEAFDWSVPTEPADLAGVRAAFSVDLGIAPVDRMIQSVLRARVGKFGQHFVAMDEATPDCSGGHDIFEIHRGLVLAGAHEQQLLKHRDALDVQVVDGAERGLRLTAGEIARAFAEQHRFFVRWHEFFDDYDVLITPGAAVSPFPHRQRFVEEINGEKLPVYTTWLSLAYLPTMALACVAAVPCGRDEKGMPFGLQVIGPKGHDRRILEIALALEQLFAADDEMARPLPPDPAISAPVASPAAAKKRPSKAAR